MATYTSRFPGSGTFIEESILKGQAEGLAKGLAEARAEDILRLLSFREIHIPEGAQERITGCTDLETLDVWFARAFTATSTEELFAET